MTATYEQLDIDTIRQRTQHGLPITQEQQRWLVEQVSGPLEGKKTRCQWCEGEGTILQGEVVMPMPGSFLGVAKHASYRIPCDQCGGDGYIMEQPESDVRPIVSQELHGGGAMSEAVCRMCSDAVGDSVGGNDGLCQICWEAVAAKSWWEKTIAMNGVTGIEADICREIAQRQKMGKAKYGQQLSDNPADIEERLQHLKEELLDGAIYCEWAIREMKK